MGINIKITDNFDKFLSELERKKQIILEQIGSDAKGFAVEEIADFPYVDTGRARNSIIYTVKDSTVYICSNVEYFVYLELGTGIYASDGKGETHWTRGLKPSHVLQNSVSKSEYLDVYKQVIELVLKA